MTTPKITINGKEILMKNLSVNDWIELAKIYDNINTEKSNLEFMINRCKNISIAFDIPIEELQKLPAEDILPIYNEVTNVFNDILTKKIEKKIDADAKITEI